MEVIYIMLRVNKLFLLLWIFLCIPFVLGATDDFVACWDFENDTESTSVFNITSTGEAVVAGIQGNAYETNPGEGDLLNYAFSDNDLTDNHAMSCWFYWDNNIRSVPFQSYGAGAGNDGWDTTGGANFFWKSDYNGGGANDRVNIGAPPIKTWHMMSGMRNSTGKMSVYLNATVNSTSVNNAPALNPEGVNFTNREGADDNRVFDGIIDRCVIYNHTLTLADYAVLYNGGSPVSCASLGAAANVKPSIELSSPGNSVSVSNNSLVFRYNYTDSEASAGNCNITIDGSKKNTSDGTVSGSVVSWTWTNFTFGSKNWNVSCNDGTDTNTSSTYSFSVVKNSTVSEMRISDNSVLRSWGSNQFISNNFTSVSAGSILVGTFESGAFDINDPPVWNQFNLTTLEDIDISEWNVTGNVTTFSSVTYSVTVVGNSSLANCAISSNGLLNVSVGANLTGWTNCTLKAVDDDGSSSSVTYINVTSVNDIPIWTQFNLSTMKNINLSELNITGNVTDFESSSFGVDLNITVVAHGNITATKCNVSLNGLLNVTVGLNAIGTENCTLNADDGDNSTNTTTFITILDASAVQNGSIVYGVNWSRATYNVSDWYSSGTYKINISESGVITSPTPQFNYNLTNDDSVNVTIMARINDSENWFNASIGDTALSTSYVNVVNLTPNDWTIFNVSLGLIDALQVYNSWVLAVNNATWNFVYEFTAVET